MYVSLKKNLNMYQVNSIYMWGINGTRFTKDFLLAIQIRWRVRITVISLLAIRSQQILAHATTAQLSCHVQNFVATAVFESKWE